MVDESLPFQPLPRRHLLALLFLWLVLNAIVVKLTYFNEQLAAANPVDVDLKGPVAAALALAGAILAAIWVTLGLHAYSALLRRSVRKKFCELFGMQRPDHGTIIVIPRFSVGDFADTSSQSGTNGISLKKLNELDRRCISLDDMIAVRYIIALLAEQGIAPPKLFFDDDVHAVVFGGRAPTDPELEPIQKARNIINIGLFSNELTTTINQRTEREDQRSFQLSSPVDYFNGQRQIDIAQPNDSLEEWRLKRTQWLSECRDAQFALFAKVRAPGSRQIIIVGGSTARATRKLARILREDWLRTFEFKAGARKEKLGSNPFSRFYLIPNQDQREPEAGFVHYSDA